MNFFEKIASLIFPHKCTFCREAISYTNHMYICKKCMETIPFITGSRCIKCNSPQSDTALPICYNCRHHNYSFSASFTPLIYKDEVRHSIISMKFYEKASFCHSYAYLIANNIIKEGFPSFDFISYIPLSNTSLKNRGFNQAELIAKECGKILNLPVIETLTRVDSTPRQSTLSEKERHKNAKKSFKPKNVKLKGTALLIDDIYTTGSTMDFTSSLLLKMGCDQVCIACVALKTKD